MKAPKFLLCLLGFQAAALAQTWTAVESGLTSTLYTSHFLDDATGWIAGDGAVLRKTTDGGATWIPQEAQRNVSALAFPTSGTGWAVGGSLGTGNIRKTTDGGTTWTTQRDGDLPVLWDVAFTDTSIGWAVGALGTIVRTFDGGATWGAQNSGTTVDLRAVHFVDGYNGWASGASGMLLKTTNGGSTWVKQNSGTLGDLVDLFFLDVETGWAVGSGGVLLKTTNGGAKWTAQNAGTTHDLSAITFLDGTTGYAGGGNGILLKTIDGGATWEIQGAGTTRQILSIQVLSGEAAWIVGASGLVLKASSPFPVGLKYPTNPAAYTVGRIITPNIPSVWGSRPFTYSVTPALPPGLILDSETGILFGTPLYARAPTNYVVTASNMYGSTTTTLNIRVDETPSALSYSSHPAVYELNVPIPPNTPKITGTPTFYSVSPPLPQGLVLNAFTGVITGTPTVPTATQNYTITASNASGGSTTTILNLTVLLRPSDLIYSENPAAYTRGEMITPNVPSARGSGPMAYTISPDLPKGLSFHMGTGVISGVPEETCGPTSFTLTAQNAVGATETTITLSVAGDGTPVSTTAGGRTFRFSARGAPGLEFKAPRATETARLKLLDERGVTVWEGNASARSEFAWESRLAPGLYILRLTWLDSSRRPLGTDARRFTALR